jgi:hypothetical protein
MKWAIFKVSHISSFRCYKGEYTRVSANAEEHVNYHRPCTRTF